MKKLKREKASARSVASSPVLPANLEEQIRLRAYQLYEQRGRQDGFAEQDWIQAEGELLPTANSLKAAV